ncbi:MAG TPA: queuosine precursor transporter [Candidatus Avidesulfovibrio excrementigallinarum]|nr:queuosine precursor transporter [Candidatus Avidesulfovibrio excrementigallinarum]
MKNKTVSLSFMLLGMLFCVCLICSNLLETKIIQVGTVTITAGFLVFPVSYIINDCIAEVWGFRKARLIIWLGFLLNFMALAIFQIALVLPAAPFWQGADAFQFVFGLAPRITVASLLAFLVGSFLNAYVMSRMKVASQGRHFSVRAVLSTLAGETADSLVFFPIAFWGLIPAGELLKLIVIQAVAKTAYEIVVLPLTIRIVAMLKRVEQTDVYDEHISYNILRVGEI